MILPVDPARYAAWLGVTAVMVATPGPANLFAIATGATRGRRGVLAAVVGMNLASLVWIAGASLGLGALALTFPAAFRILALAGAAYVAWLGAKAIGSALRPADEVAGGIAPPTGSSFRQGFAVQISNPKALLFTTAVLPPFLDPARAIVPQIVMLAGTTVVGDVVAMTAYGFGGAALAARMGEPAFRRGFALFTGALLVAIAVMIGLRA